MDNLRLITIPISHYCEKARSVGVGHAAPYRHFKSKQELLQAIAIYGFRKLTHACELAE